MPFGTRAPSRPKRSGSRRKSTTSCSSSFASSRPATSSHETDASPTIVFAAVTFGITSSVRQRTYVIRTSRTTKNSGSQAPSSSRKTTSQSIPLSLSAASTAEATSGGFYTWRRAAGSCAFRSRDCRRGLARPVRGARETRRGVGARARAPTGGRGHVPDLPRRRRRPEHVLHPGLRAVRRRPLRERRRRRQPPSLRLPLSKRGRDHPDRADARHAPGDADLPRDLARGRGGAASAAVYARLCGGGRGRPVAGGSRGRRGARARHGLRAPSPPPLHPGAGGERQVPPDDLALPRNARRDRTRARLGGRGGDLLPHRRAPVAAGLPAEGPFAADRALLGGRPRKRAP